MCGTVGMFVGCAALAFCPLHLLAPQPDGGPGADEAAQDESGYRSVFDNWHERASVRRAPRRMVTAETDVGQFFSPDLVPVARHPLVEQLPVEAFDEILIQHLYQYLRFTAQLETLVVNRTILGIAQGSVNVRVPEPMAFDAYKMYCDEAYHALFSVDLARQVLAHTKVVPRLPGEPFFLRRLAEICADLPAGHEPLAELLFVIVSETLISGSLLVVPDADGVVPAVRETIRDHALDEGRHHAYFAAFLRLMWGQLDPGLRVEAARLVPRLIDAFLRPDLGAVRLNLLGHGMRRDDVEQVVAEVYRADVVSSHAQAAARQTLRYFEELDAFADALATAELHAYGLAG